MILTLIDMFAFIFKSQKLWMIPIVIIMLFLAIVLFVGQGSVVAPFIYTIF